MNTLTDQELLRNYTASRSEAAFAELVRRHVDFVYSAALRMVHDAHTADDVTQGVFMALAENAGKLTDRPILAGWLHRTTQFLALARNFPSREVLQQTMIKLPALLMTVACFVANSVVAVTYSTEATMSLQKDEGIYNVVVRVSKLVEQDGKLVEQLISEPRLKSAPGVPASLHSGLQPSDPNYANEENVTVDVSWPYPNESGTALCAILVKRGDTIVSKSKLQLQIQGPGRTPLMVTPSEVDPKSVRVVDEKSKTFVLLEFTGKTKEAVKKVANENYGNKFYIRNSQGTVTEGGLSFGTYKEIGMAVQYESKDEAERVARILRGENPK